MAIPWLGAQNRGTNDLASQPDGDKEIPTKIGIGRDVTWGFAARTDGVPMGSLNEGPFDVPMTAHMLRGCPIGRGGSEGVVDADFQVHNYPGLFVIDGSIMRAHPGINPSLMITALAEHARSRVPEQASSSRPAGAAV